MNAGDVTCPAGRQEQLLPEEDFRRFLRDFKVVPKLLNDTDITVMLRMTLRGFPSVLIRKRKRRGFVARRRSSVFAASGNFDSASLIEDDAGSLQLTYAQYLDVLGRVAVSLAACGVRVCERPACDSDANRAVALCAVAHRQVVAFAQPPYRNRYDNTKDRIRGFFVDYLGVTGKRRLETARGAPDGGDDASTKSDWRAMVCCWGLLCSCAVWSPCGVIAFRPDVGAAACSQGAEERTARCVFHTAAGGTRITYVAYPACALFNYRPQ